MMFFPQDVRRLLVVPQQDIPRKPTVQLFQKACDSRLERECAPLWRNIVGYFDIRSECANDGQTIHSHRKNTER